jgi:ATP-dependent exoDNAse (exonuclease V) beta subunit
VALTKDDFPEEVRSATKIAVQQEMARLLYVATTRARHTLVLAFDEEIFARSNGEVQNGAQLKCLLGEKEINRSYFETLSLEPSDCLETIRATEQALSGADMDTSPFARISRKELKQAKERAATFTRKFNPSGYDEEITIETIEQAPWIHVSPRSSADTPATLYGRWWHDLMQRISWHDESSWKQVFEEHKPKSPATTRSMKEWDLFLQCLKNGPDFSDLLTREGPLAHPEMPLFWGIDGSTCLEGIVDLARFDQDAKKWFILDWKTNRIAPDKIDELRAQYLPQLAAYWKAIAEMTQQSVSAGIYSTATGRFVAYEEGELEREWARLSKL